jgi:hypothetical protein
MAATASGSTPLYAASASCTACHSDRRWLSAAAASARPAYTNSGGMLAVLAARPRCGTLLHHQVWLARLVTEQLRNMMHICTRQ